MARLNILAFRTYWHPAATPGGRRWESFCRYLAEADMDVTMLALRPPARCGFGDSTPSVPYRRVWVEHAIRPGSLFAGLEQRARKWFPVLLNEGYAQARRRVHSAAVEWLGRERFDGLLTTYPSESSLQVAHRLHARFGLPWVADLRDLPDEFDPGRRGWGVRRRAASVETWCRSAACVVTVSGPLRQALSGRYGLRMPIEIIHNGYDEEAFEACGRPAPPGSFDVLFCGGARPGDGRSAELLGRGLAELHRRRVDLGGVRIVLVGPNDAESLGLGPSSRLPVPVVHRGVVPHAEALAAIASASVLVSLSSPAAQGILSSKIFEYARAGRPVLSIPRDGGALDEFIRRARIGQACDTPEEVAEFIHGGLRTWRRTGQPPAADVDRSYLAGFTRRAQARRLAEVLRSCF